MTSRDQIISIVSLLLLSSAAFGGPLEDGQAAYKKNDFATAAQDFAAAAAQGDSLGQGLLGIMYVYGLGLKADPAQGAQWLKLSADKGNMGAQDLLGDLYAKGNGVQQSWPEAYRLYQLAGGQGNADAQNSLGDMFYTGKPGVAVQNYSTAMSWYNLAAKQSNASAEFTLGYMNYFGQGTAKNFADAVTWFVQSAENNNAAAQAYLGLAYENGQGVPQNYGLAARYYELSARQGNLTGMAFLGESYGSGKGVPQDYAKAYAWLSMASSQLDGDLGAAVMKERDTVSGHLSATQIAAEQSITAECLSSNMQKCEVDGGDIHAGPTKTPPLTKGPERIARAGVPPPNTNGRALSASGSGFFVSGGGQIVTNAHVVSGCGQIRSAQGGVLKQIAIDTQSDLALLVSTTKPTSFATLRGGHGDKLGEPITIVGFPLHGILGSDPIVTSGSISTLSGLKNDRRNIQISAPVQLGNSGGPVLGEDGAVVGVVVSKLDAVRFAGAVGDIPQNVNFAVSLGTLQSFLNANGVQYVLSGDKDLRKSSSLVAAEASRYTVALECWK